jgi:uncharacterized membrane protein YdbT with pleckstrin-like domain
MPEVFKAKGKKDVEEVRKMLGDFFTGSVLGSFVLTPQNLKFESQHEDEEVIVIGRRHPITNLWWLAIVCMAVFVPTIWGSFPLFQSISELTVTKITLLWYLGLLFYSIQHFLLWFYNIYIVTDERLVDVDFMGLLHKTVNIARLDDVVDVNYSQGGLADSIFNMGDVIVQTSSEQKTPDASGEASAFTFESVAYPDKLAHVISRLVDLEEEENRHHL